MWSLECLPEGHGERDTGCREPVQSAADHIQAVDFEHEVVESP